MSLDFDDLCLLLLHPGHLLVQSGLLIGGQLHVEKCRFKNARICRQMLLAHLAEELLTEPGHLGTQVVNDSLHLFLLCQKGGYLCLKPLYLEVFFRHYPSFFTDIKLRKINGLYKYLIVFFYLFLHVFFMTERS